MKRFEQLHFDEQNLLVIHLMKAFCENDCGSVEQLAHRHDCSVREVWRDICADTGLDECEPWEGYPDPPWGWPPAEGQARYRNEATPYFAPKGTRGR